MFQFIKFLWLKLKKTALIQIPQFEVGTVTIVKRNQSLYYVFPFCISNKSPPSYSCEDVHPVFVAKRLTSLVMTLMHNRKHTGPGGSEEHRIEALGAVKVSGQ